MVTLANSHHFFMNQESMNALRSGLVYPNIIVLATRSARLGCGKKMSTSARSFRFACTLLLGTRFGSHKPDHRHCRLLSTCHDRPRSPTADFSGFGSKLEVSVFPNASY
jgi:hypothetical protein